MFAQLFSRRAAKSAGSPPRRTSHRALRFEALEGRDMLTALFVTSDDDAGAGTFRDAIAQANADPTVSFIKFHPSVDLVELISTVEYTGEQRLRIDGSLAAIEAATGLEGTFDLFVSSGGADLALWNVAFAEGRTGVYVPVPVGATGTVDVDLHNVTIADSAQHGLHVDDQTNATDAGVRLNVWRSSITGNGTGAGLSDFDGIRVDEDGLGSIFANFISSHVLANGGDGVELDECCDGDVTLLAAFSSFDDNGFQDPADLEDGFDIDEADGGSVRATILHSTANGNDDEGLDFNETGLGDIFAQMAFVSANDSGGDGIQLDESDDGSVRAHFTRVTAMNNGDDGIQVEEAGTGDLWAHVVFSTVTGNAGAGVHAEQAAPGIGRLFLIGNDLAGNTGGPFAVVGVNVTMI